jgi:hypothetical protein
MRKIGTALAVVAVLLGVAAGPGASAGDLLGVGASVAIGSQAPAPPPRYYEAYPYAPPTAYAAPAPDYVPVPPNCYWAHGEPVWDGYRWVEPRVQVCD